LFHQSVYFVRSNQPNKILSISCGRYRAGPIVCIGAGTNDRGVTETPWSLVCIPPSRGSSSKVPVLVQGDGPNRSMPVLIGNNQFLASQLSISFCLLHPS